MKETYRHWIENKHGASKIIDMFATYQQHVTSKIIFVITYLLEDEQELSLGMLIRCKRIYNI